MKTNKLAVNIIINIAGQESKVQVGDFIRCNQYQKFIQNNLRECIYLIIETINCLISANMYPEIVASFGKEKQKHLLQKRRHVWVNFRISDGRVEIRNTYLGNARAELDITFARLYVSICLNKLA
jgi:hypothetical protein